MKLSIFIIVIGTFIILTIVNKVRKKSFSEKESLIWVLAGLIIFTFSIFPSIEIKISKYLGITYGPTFLFLIGFIGVIFILLRKEEQITKINDKLKDLGQRNAILEEKLRKKDKN